MFQKMCSICSQILLGMVGVVTFGALFGGLMIEALLKEDLCKSISHESPSRQSIKRMRAEILYNQCDEEYTL